MTFFEMYTLEIHMFYGKTQKNVKTNVSGMLLQCCKEKVNQAKL